MKKSRSLYPKGLGYSWSNMKRRCFDKNNPDYKSWGGRGITVCERWLKFENFAEDMFPTYKDGLTLDRIDNNGDYCKENCRWATRKEQNNNRRDNKRYEFKGINMTLTAWAKYLGMNKSTVEMRILAYGWSIERALTEKPRNAKRKYITTSV